MGYRQDFELMGGRRWDCRADGRPVLSLYPVSAVIETEAVVSATGSQTLGQLMPGKVVFINRR